jgi:pimeloyl-ACP methyl ester carboxylesterase
MATQVQITEKSAEMSHGKTRYFEAGSGYPTILIHGAGIESGADGWLITFDDLASQLRVLSIDSLNWGPGDVFDQEFSFAYQVDHIREFMDVLGIEKANIVGHSMGGWLATLFAYESPERVNRLVLVAAGGAATRPLQNMVDWTPPDPAGVRERISARVTKASVPVNGDAIVESYVKKVTDPQHTGAFAKVMKHMTNPMTRSRYNVLRRLPYIKAPTLILWGDNDKTNDVSMGEALRDGIKGSKLVVFPDTGHGVPQERPKEFAKEVLDFLK